MSKKKNMSWLYFVAVLKLRGEIWLISQFGILIEIFKYKPKSREHQQYCFTYSMVTIDVSVKLILGTIVILKFTFMGAIV